MESPPAQFANQTIRLQFPKDVHWGDDITVWIAKAGDLARTMYLRVMWPADAPTTVQPSAGTAMIDRIELLYKDQLVERIYGENLYMLGDLTVTEGKQAALSNMVGTNTTSNLVSYHIPLVFSILKKGLPLCALDEPPKLRVVFQPSSYFTTAVYTKQIQVDLFVDYVYVTAAEREYMRSRELIYVTQSFQRVQFRVPAMTQAPVQFLSEFVNDVKELFWVIQSDAASNVYDYGTTDHLVDLRLILNGQDRITPDYATAQYLRVVQGLQSHTRVPTGRYYMYSFALEPENDTPTGELNMTNIARQQHTLTLSLHIYPRSIRMYALSYNIFSVSKGDGRSMYTIQEAGMQNKSVVDAVPAQVGNFVATVQSPTQVNLAWTPTGASYYITSSPSTTGYTIAPSGSFSFTGLSPATTYTFTISPINKGSIGLPAISNTVKTYADVPQVTGFLGYNPTIITVDLIWDPDLLNKTTLYSVTSNPASSTPTQTSTIASMTFTGLIPLTSYTFTITPSNADGDGPSTTSSPVTTLSIIPEAVSVLTPSNPTRTTMYLEWPPVLYATLYSFTSNPPSSTPTQTTTNAGTFTFTGLTESTSYTFTITPSNGGGSGPSTTSVSASTLLIPPAVSVLTPSNPTTSTVDLTWSSVSYATLYSITSDPPSTTPTQTWETAGTVTFIGLTADTTYTFTITPSTVQGAGPTTTSVSITTAVLPWRATATPAGSSVDGTNGIAVSGSNVYITGQYGGSCTFYNANDVSTVSALGQIGGNDIFVAKYDSTGVCQWRAKAGSTATDRVFGIAVSGSNVYIAGSYVGGSCTFYNANDVSTVTALPGQSTNYDSFIANYSSTGVCQWRAKAEVSGGPVMGRSITASSTAVYIAGRYSGGSCAVYDKTDTQIGTSLGPSSGTLIAKYPL